MNVECQKKFRFTWIWCKWFLYNGLCFFYNVYKPKKPIILIGFFIKMIGSN